MGHLRTAKLLAFMSQHFFWTSLYKDVMNVFDSCLTCVCIHSTIDYKHMKSFEAVCTFQMVSLNIRVITYGNDQKFFFVVAVNHFTCWIKVRVLTHEILDEIIHFIKDLIIV